MKIAIIHDWLLSYAGSERVLEQIVQLFPNANLYSIVDFIPENNRDFILHKPVTTTFIQKIPFAAKWYRNYLPLMPLAIEQFDLTEYDLIISSSHAVAKGVLTSPNQVHISYVHTPIRYAWDLQHQYLRESGLNNGVKGCLARLMLHRMRMWDYRTANGVDYYIANSKFIAKRIWKVYHRDATVIYPPVSVNDFACTVNKDDYYLAASRMVPYKKIDLIVEAFAHMPNQKLVVIGDGPEFKRIKSKVTSNISLLGYQPYEILRDYMQRAKAFVFAAEEDFGIIPVEAQACGTPVIAYGKGGTLETIKGLDNPNPTGLFFDEQTIDSLKRAIDAFEIEAKNISYSDCRENALRFSVERFREEFSKYIKQILG